MSEPADEFSFLAEQAADIGVDPPLPRGERVGMTLPDGRALSAIRYSPGPSTGSGTASGPAVTFLHGAGLNAHTWDTTILALGLPALAIDLPGHGDSSWRADAAYTARVLAPDVIAGMDAWTDEPQTLVGHSLGGLTAAAVAASRPDLVRRLVIVDITPGIDPDGNASALREFFAGPADWASRDELVERALAFGLGGSRTAATRGVFFNSRVRPDGRVEWKHHFARLANAATAAPEHRTPTPEHLTPAPEPVEGPLAALLASTGWEDFSRVQAPLLLIRGDRGYVTEQDAADFAARLPQASIVTLPSGHNVHEALPLELGRRIAELATSDDGATIQA
ncbi:MAG: alpha/beta hydrolase [Microbacterium sp.]|uniref:alpha/beta fold hydrolase n=1 Tax=Microbacterium sp. TaxID=51671 RepID=UPI0039E310EC